MWIKSARLSNNVVEFKSEHEGSINKIEIITYFKDGYHFGITFVDKEHYERFVTELVGLEIGCQKTIKYDHSNSIELEEPTDLIALMKLLQKLDTSVESINDEIRDAVRQYKIRCQLQIKSGMFRRFSSLAPFSLAAIDTTIHDKQPLASPEKARSSFLLRDIREGAKQLSAIMLQEEKAKARLDDPDLSPTSRAKAIEDFLLLGIEKRDLARENFAKVEEEISLLRRSTP